MILLQEIQAPRPSPDLVLNTYNLGSILKVSYHYITKTKIKFITLYSAHILENSKKKQYKEMKREQSLYYIGFNEKASLKRIDIFFKFNGTLRYEKPDLFVFFYSIFWIYFTF